MMKKFGVDKVTGKTQNTALSGNFKLKSKITNFEIVPSVRWV
jgi:hypothetical protein